MRRDDLRRAHEVTRTSLMALRGGDVQCARAVLIQVVDEEEDEPEEEDEVMEVEAEGMQSE